MSEHYIISLGFKPGKALTPAQRLSSLFSEEPVVMGKVMRRGLPPRKITKEQYEANKLHLLRLAKAGSIVITEPDNTLLTPDEIAEQEFALRQAAEKKLEQLLVETFEGNLQQALKSIGKDAILAYIDRVSANDAMMKDVAYGVKGAVIEAAEHMEAEAKRVAEAQAAQTQDAGDAAPPQVAQAAEPVAQSPVEAAPAAPEEAKSEAAPQTEAPAPVETKKQKKGKKE